MTEEEKKARQREYNKRSYEKNKDSRRAETKAWQQKNPTKNTEHQRRSQLKRLYSITLAQYDDLLAAQNEACALCASPAPSGRGRLHVDHCHTTGAVRGLLCGECNLGLGKFKDNTDTLLKAVDYLKAAPHVPSPPS
jgi:ATPase subunit of ABC transporter with duplicated ATPase domains